MHGSIAFAQDGQRIVVRTPTGLALVPLHATTAPITLAIPELHAFATVADQLWVVAGSPATLTAYDDRGAPLATIGVPAPGATPRLVRAAGGARLACWMGAQATVIAHERELVATEVAGEVDFALPLSPSRVLVASRGRLALREQTSVRWTVALPATSPNAPIVDAALVLDGKAVAIALGSTTGHGTGALAVVGLRDGALLHRINIEHAAGVRFAPARGIALVHTQDARLLLIDLRFGRLLVDHPEPRAITEAAIDDAGRELALRLAEPPGEVVHVTVAALLSAAATTPSRDHVVPPPAPPPPPPTTTTTTTTSEPPSANGQPAASAPTDPFDAGDLVLRCDAVPPRPSIAHATTAELRALHARHRELAIAILGVAIAKAWDEGRLAYPQAVGLPFHSEVSGVTAGQRGLASEELQLACQRLDEALGATFDARAAIAPRLAPLDALAAELGLTSLARDLVLLIAAPSLWGELARLYGILANDEGRPLVDELLLTELLADRADAAAITRELDDDAPLIRHGVVRVQPGRMRPFLPLLVDPVVLRLLRGVPLEPVLEPVIRARAADRTFAELRIPTATKQRLIADLRHAAAPVRIAIRGRVGAGRHTLLAALAGSTGRRLGVIDATAIVREGAGRAHELAIALERTRIAGMLPCVDGLEAIASHDTLTREQVRDVLRRHTGPLAVRLPWEVQPLLDPGHVLIELPALSLTDRLTSWQRTLAAHRLHVAEVDELCDRYAVGPGVVERVAAEVARTGDAGPDAGPRLEAGIRQHLETRLAGSANRVTRLATWAQVILPADIQDSLTELIARIKHRRTVFDTWGFDHVMSTSRGVTALFQGGPGTGKTLVASAIANELGMDLYRVDLSRVMSKWIGETEQNLARLFDAAEDGNTIILFDEADSLFAKRTEVKSSVDRYANLEVNYLLQRMDTFEGIAILTTNFGTSIDSAFKRRLSLRLTFPFPDDEMRERLWRAHLPAAVPTAGAFDLAEVARRYQLSGGYIRNAALRAAFLAAEEHAPLTQEHLERAIKAEFREIGKIAESGILE